MSFALPPKPRVFGQKVRICIIASEYNKEFTDALVENTLSELEELVPSARVDLIRVPGAFEIPATAAFIADKEEVRCIIALGLIIEGQTKHADLIGASITNALQDLAVAHKIPVIHEVLLVQDEKQAYARCIAPNINRGTEAARSAARMVDIFSELASDAPSRR